ncbi:ATP-binding protein [Clostridium sp.]|uniref:ATP-binding protein n=1 Tax=Clostridium sp. TaxID=1506 RepID=UPI0032163A2B
MPIRKKMIMFVFIVVIGPMIFIFILSNSVLNYQIEKAAQGYLQNALIIARNQMINRLNEMEKLGINTAKSLEFQEAIEGENTKILNKTVSDINEVYDYIDFYMVFDGEKKLLISQPNVKNPENSRLRTLIDEAEKMGNTITSEEQFSLDDLFLPDSEEYNKFKVLINNNKDKNTGKYLTKCLTAVNISPIYNKESNKIIGFLVLGTIVNNDSYFPQVYSKSVQNSYLAISIDGIRISSNIRSPKNGNYIGSSIPIPLSTLEGTRNAYFGKQNFDGEIHIFLDDSILNCDGDKVGVLGVGIPEYKFSIIMNIQRNIIICVSILGLAIMTFIGIVIAKRITEPIIKATELANQISQRNNEVLIDKRFLEGKNSETTILLKAFQEMAYDLKKGEEEKSNYLEKLKYEHFEQQKLSEELAVLNENLEEKVKLRTQDLREAIIGLKRAGEIKSLFLANMSHELRTPLSSIITCSEILKDELFGTLNDKQYKYTSNILNSSNHLLKLINDVLDISKIEAGKMNLVLGLYSISEVIMEGFHVVKSLAYRKNIDITINIVPNDFTIKVDANKLKQILYNLLANAIKFTSENGKVTVDVYKNGEYMQLTVKDNGIGIKAEDQERIFNEFEQVDSSYEREYEGTGLGLPLTKKIVEMHGGKIFLHSILGKGTEVIVTLPINIE